MEMLGRKCLVRMNDLAVTVALAFCALNGSRILSGRQSENRAIIDISLSSSQPSLYLAGLRCVEQISSRLYSPKYLTMVYRDVLELTTAPKHDQNTQQKWTILKTIVRHHLISLNSHTRGLILSGIRRIMSS